MDRPDALVAARTLVATRFPEAVQAWLAGSVTTGTATQTSDLDITVLMESTVVRRESLVYDGWPVELFVHEHRSVRHFVEKDLARRRPTMPRLVATGIPLVAGGGGTDLLAYCERVLREGPGPLEAGDLDRARYGLTDLLDDLRGGGGADLVTAVAVEVWRETAELVLAAHEHWGGTGKWLVRELADLDDREGTSYGAELHVALRSAVSGDVAALAEMARRVLGLVGGPLWTGYRSEAPRNQ
jgi:hypothetical protein